MTGLNTEITPQQQRFIAEYLVDLNGTQAAIRAGYAPKAAAQQASRLLSLAKIKAAVAKGQLRIAEKVEFSAAVTLQQLCYMLSLDPARMYDSEGRILPVPMMPPEVRACLASVKVSDIEEKRDELDADGNAKPVLTRTQKTEVRFWSKTAALIMAMKHFDLVAAAGLTIQQRSQDQEAKAAATRGALLELVKRSQAQWHQPAAEGKSG